MHEQSQTIVRIWRIACNITIRSQSKAYASYKITYKYIKFLSHLFSLNHRYVRKNFFNYPVVSYAVPAASTVQQGEKYHAAIIR